MNTGAPSQQLPRRRTSYTRDDGTQAQVLAAGALCWRLHKGFLEVLIVHRPRYDDWSFPKGKLDDGETLPECAVREVREEVGLKLRLGVPLPTIRYDIVKTRKTDSASESGSSETRVRSKEVWYWAAEVKDEVAKPDNHETDKVEWVTIEQARERLSNTSDLEPLEALAQMHEKRRLKTSAFVVLRHAKAKPRASWTRAESERPLAATGKRQARSIERLLVVWRPRHLESSPWRRCVETLAPYVKLHRHRIKYRKSLTETVAAANPKKAKDRTRKSLEVMQPSCLCTHRPVLPSVMEELKRWVKDPDISSVLPTKDPYLRPGSVIVAQQAVDRGGEIVSLEIYEPFED